MKKSVLTSIICVCSVSVICSIAVPLGIHAKRNNDQVETIRKNAKVSTDTNSGLIYTLVEDEDNPANSYWKVGIDTTALTYCNGYTKKETKLTVPDTYEDTENEYGSFPVKAIGENAFSYNTSLQNVTLGNNITRIGLDAFAYCTNLISVKITNNVEFIDYGAFRGDVKLTTVSTDGKKGISLPTNENFTEVSSFLFTGCTSISTINSFGNATVINNSAFYGDTSLVIDADGFSGITKIGTLAFAGCTKISGRINFADATAIEQYAFYGDLSIEKVVFSKRVYIGNHAFRGLKALAIFLVGAECSSKSSQSNWNDGLSNYFENCNFNTEIDPITDTTLTIKYEHIYSDEIDVSFVSEILPKEQKITSDDYDKIESHFDSSSEVHYGSNLFDGRLDSSFTDLSIDTVYEIGQNCFANNPSITSVQITNKVKSIGKESFAECENIERMTLPFIGKELNSSNTPSGRSDDVFGYIFKETNNSAPDSKFYVALQKYAGDNNNILYSRIPNALDYITITDEEVINHAAFGELCVKNIDVKQTVKYIGHRAFIKYSATNPSRKWPTKTGNTKKEDVMSYMPYLIIRCSKTTKLQGDYCFSTNGGGNNLTKLCFTLNRTDFNSMTKSSNYNGNGAPVYYLNETASGVNSWTWNADETEPVF